MGGERKTDEVCHTGKNSQQSKKNGFDAVKIDLYKRQKFPSIFRLMSMMILSVFVVESFVESMLSYYHDCALSTHIFLDATITILLLFPLFYYLLYHPLRRLDLDRHETEAEIRSLSRQLIRTTEEERHALARDLHDDFGQHLTALQLGIETIKLSSENVFLDPEEGKANLIACHAQGEKLSGLISDLGDRVRSISSGLRPTMLDELGLVTTLEWLIGEFTDQHDAIKVRLKVAVPEERYSPEAELTVFRICQEALNNIAKHAHAEQVLVDLHKGGTDLVLLIKDDGVGFGSDEIQSARAGRRGTGKQGVGLLGMRERATALEGFLEIKSVKGRGTEVCLKIPTVRQQRKGE